MFHFNFQIPEKFSKCNANFTSLKGKAKKLTFASKVGFEKVYHMSRPNYNETPKVSESITQISLKLHWEREREAGT